MFVWPQWVHFALNFWDVVHVHLSFVALVCQWNWDRCRFSNSFFQVLFQLLFIRAITSTYPDLKKQTRLNFCTDEKETSQSCKLNCWNKIKDFYSTSLSSSGSATGGAAVAVSHCYCFMHFEFKHAQKELEISGTVSLGVGVLDKKLENTLFVWNLKPPKAIVNNPRDQDPQWPKFKRLQPWL